jgi:hypothetical protein
MASCMAPMVNADRTLPVLRVSHCHPTRLHPIVSNAYRNNKKMASYLFRHIVNHIIKASEMRLIIVLDWPWYVDLWQQPKHQFQLYDVP